MIDPRSLDDLAIFAAVGHHQSFVGASRRLGLPTSSVSRAVARLEEALRLSLLRRTSRRVALTDAGRQLLLGTAPLLEGLGEALDAVLERGDSLQGTVRATAPAFTGATRVATALAAFAAAHPQIVAELDTANGFRDLVAEGYDFAIRAGASADADFVSRRLWRSTFGLFATRALVTATIGRRRAITRSELAAAPAVVARATSTWSFLHGDQPSVIRPNVRFAVNDPRAVAAVARQGLGFAVLPSDVLATQDERLVSVPTDFGAPEPMDLHLIYPSRRLLPQRVRLAIDWLFQPRWAAS